MQARWYDPGAGRFLSVDPVIRSAATPQSANPYSYTENNPVNGVDPTGEWVLYISKPDPNANVMNDPSGAGLDGDIRDINANASKAGGGGAAVGAGAAGTGSAQGAATQPAAATNPAPMFQDGANGNTDSFGPKDNVRGLDPKFKEKVGKVVDSLREDGWNPRVAEGHRTPAEQAQKIKDRVAPRGSDVPGSPNASMHLSDRAADVIDRRWGWRTPGGKSHAFWGALGKAAGAQGLVWGGNFDPNGFHGPGGDVAHNECPAGGC